MGLGFHGSNQRRFEDRPSWSYSGFGRFRSVLAEKAGIDLSSMSGYGGRTPWPDDPIVPLLNHSDCHGELSPEACALVAPRLRELLDEMDGDPENDYDVHHGRLLADMMDECAAGDYPLEFV